MAILTRGFDAKLISMIDPLYGKIKLRRWEYQLVETPELQRLREIRVCNISFFYMPGCSGFSRFEHTLGVTYLAKTVSEILGLDKIQTMNLVVASVLHDIGIPPFSHTTEKVLKAFFGFSHEENTVRIIKGEISQEVSLSTGTLQKKMGKKRKEEIFCGMVSEVPTVLRRLKEKGQCDPEQVISTILGQGTLGEILNSAHDIDNIDGITRTYLHSQGNLAFVEPSPLDLLELFKKNPDGYISFDVTHPLSTKWEKKRRKLYRILLDNPLDCAADAMLGRATEKAIAENYLDENLWKKTDIELISDLVNEEKMRKCIKNEKEVQEIKTLISRLRTGKLYIPIFRLECKKETAVKVREMNSKYETKKEIEYRLQKRLEEKRKLKCDIILSVPIFWETKEVSSKEENAGPKTRLDVYSSLLLKPRERVRIRQEFEDILQDALGEVSLFEITDKYMEYKPDSLLRGS